MKNIHIIKTLLLGVLSAACMLSSCTAGFEETNRPGDKLNADELNRDGYAAGSFLIQLQNEAFPEQENNYQMHTDLIGNYCGRYFTYANGGFNANFVCMNAPTGWVDSPFKDAPKTTTAFNDIRRITDGKGVTYAMALLLRAQSLLRLTDTYGPFPIGADENDEKAYSSQKDVYNMLFGDINNAIEILTPNTELIVNALYDNIFGGSVAKWMKFANSLKLRMAIRIRFVEPRLAKQYAEEAVAAGVMTTNDDNLAITYEPNGLYKTSVEWGDTRACADIESYMSGYKDARQQKFFKPAEITGNRAIIGCRAGAKIGSKDIATKLYSMANVDKNDRGVWMTAAEMFFNRAEGATLGWNMGGTAKELYEQGIKTSFEQWGASGADSYLADATSVPANYADAEGGYGGSAVAVSKISVKWDDNASAEQNQERISVQKWIAMFPNGDEGWAEIRRSGYPKVFASAQGPGSDLTTPNRIPFCSTEPVNNPTNYAAAVQMLGGQDTYITPMWWQRNK